jgi:hypothetical protein
VGRSLSYQLAKMTRALYFNIIFLKAFSQQAAAEDDGVVLRLVGYPSR